MRWALQATASQCARQYWIPGGGWFGELKPVTGQSLFRLIHVLIPYVSAIRGRALYLYFRYGGLVDKKGSVPFSTSALLKLATDAPIKNSGNRLVIAIDTGDICLKPFLFR